MILTSLAPERTAFERATGWTLKPEGACRGDVCVPLGDVDLRGTAAVDVPAVAERLGMPLIHDDERHVWALGPATIGGRALTTAEAPDLVLPDARTGEPFALTNLRGRKTVMVAWASW